MARDFEAEARAVWKENRARFYDYFTERQREQIDARERAKIETVRDTLGRLFDPNAAPIRADYKAVLSALEDFPALSGLLKIQMKKRLGAIGWRDWIEAEKLDFHELLVTQIADARIEILKQQNAHLPTPSPVAPELDAHSETPAIGASSTATGAKVKPTEAEKLDGDRRRYEADGPGKGRVTMRLLRDLLGGVARSTLSYRLNELFNAGKIASPKAEKLTAKEVLIVLNDVAENPFRKKT